VYAWSAGQDARLYGRRDARRYYATGHIPGVPPKARGFTLKTSSPQTWLLLNSGPGAADSGANDRGAAVSPGAGPMSGGSAG